MEFEKGLEGFLDLCQGLDREELKELFSFFLTMEEQSQLAARFFVIQALLSGKLTQREIAESLKVSISQITRGSNALKIAPPHLIKKLQEKLCLSKDL